MTETKLKYQLFPWLLHTQFVEICKSKKLRERADEVCDMITVGLHYIRDMGFNPAKIYEERAADKSPEFKSIHRKYRERFSVILDEIEGKKE